jgi:hypothetical protein
MIPTQGQPSLQDAQYELSLSGSVPDVAVLDELVRRYPQHAAALTDFAIALALDTFREPNEEPMEPSSPDTSPQVLKAMSRFHNRLYAVTKDTPTAQFSHHVPKAENPLTSLQRAELRLLAQRLNVNLVFVMKLRDRQILPDTIPKGFEKLMADELKVPIEVVTAHFAAQSEIQPRTYFKADQKPAAGAKQTFEEAVRSSGLTPEQEKYLLSL